MSSQYFKRHWKLIVNIVTIVALVILVFAIRDQIAQTFSNLKRVNAWFLLLLIPVEALNYHAQTRLYQRLFAIVGNKVPYKFLYRASIELNFVNHVFPSGGVTGISFFTLRLRDGKDISSGKATLIHILKIGLYFLSYELLLIFGVLALAIMGRVNNIIIVIATALTTLLLVSTVLFVYIVDSKTRINSFFVFVTKQVNHVIRLFLKKSPEAISIDKTKKLFTDFHDNFRDIKSNYKNLKAPFWYAFLADATEVAAIYVVYIAFGKFVNIGAVILAYGIANFAGAISVLPGGIGVFEALMTIALAAMGIPPALSLPVTIMYRVLNTLLQVPLGYVLYRQTIKKGGLNTTPGISA